MRYTTDYLKLINRIYANVEKFVENAVDTGLVTYEDKTNVK